VTRPPAGYFALDIRHPHILGAGCVLVCTRCNVESHAPVPRLDPTGCSTACDRFLREHRACKRAA